MTLEQRIDEYAYETTLDLITEGTRPEADLIIQEFVENVMGVKGDASEMIESITADYRPTVLQAIEEAAREYHNEVG